MDKRVDFKKPTRKKRSVSVKTNLSNKSKNKGNQNLKVKKADSRILRRTSSRSSGRSSRYSKHRSLHQISADVDVEKGRGSTDEDDEDADAEDDVDDDDYLEKKLERRKKNKTNNNGKKNSGNFEENFGVEQSMASSSGQYHANVTPGLEPLLGVTKISYGSGMPMAALESKKFNRDYIVTDQAGVEIYHGAEKVNGISEALCQGFRSFNIGLYDVAGDLIITLSQKCSFPLCFLRGECAGAKVLATLGSGQLLGSVNQICSCCIPSYEVLDPQENRIMTIVGKFGRVCFRCPAKSFRVFADVRREEEVDTIIVATIGRRYVDFKEDMNVEMKSLILAAMFLIELDYFRSCRGLLKALLFVFVLVGTALIYRLSGAFDTMFTSVWPVP